VFERIPITYRD